MNDKRIIFDSGLEVAFSYSKNPTLTIKNSYLLNDNEAIKHLLNIVHKFPEYKTLQEAGYSRTFNSEFREWKAHNFLYRIGYKKDRTRTVNIDQNETKLRLFVYKILSLF